MVTGVPEPYFYSCMYCLLVDQLRWASLICWRKHCMRPSQLQYNLNSVTRDNVNGCLDGWLQGEDPQAQCTCPLLYGGRGGGDLSWGEIGPYHLVMWASQDFVRGLSSWQSHGEGGLEHTGCCWVCHLCACRVGCRQLGGHGDRLTWDGGQAQNGPK